MRMLCGCADTLGIYTMNEIIQGNVGEEPIEDKIRDALSKCFAM